MEDERTDEGNGFDGGTQRQRVLEYLEEHDATPREISRSVGVPTSSVYEHVEHIAKSLRNSERSLMAAPPECKECGFDGFDEVAEHPSRCPECRSERIDEPVFRIE
ncbi:MAG: transcriptional regulator [Halobacteria archaeon]|nr:transcriptional regulator [Halobacteria archaeon]